MDHTYIVGAEKSLKDIVLKIDLMPLFRSAVSGGASELILEDAGGEVLFQYGGPSDEDAVSEKHPLYHEGEVAGHIIVCGGDNKDNIEDISRIVLNAIKIILQSSYKTMLATETHKTVMNQSYEELLESNKKLQASESRYRELAGNLEKEVLKRTEELKRVHAKLLQQDKIASVGQLAAGVAHEINNPLGFISSNINTLQQYVSKFRDMLTTYHDAMEKPDVTADDREQLLQKWNKLKLDFIMADVKDLIKESLNGTERVKKIVSDLRGFSHIDEASKVEIDINREIDRTLNVLSHEIPKDAEIIRDYGNLSLFTGNAARICQVFFNIILNAIQAKRDGLRLTITTRSTNHLIRIAFADNGPGIPDNIRNRIFEPFFTTKAVGTGTGMGLNVSYEIITSYGGSIEVESCKDKGTTFSLSLPLPIKEANGKIR